MPSPHAAPDASAAEAVLPEAEPVQLAASERASAPVPSGKSEPAALLPRPILSAAWLQRLGEMAPRAVAGAWQTVRLALGGADGELTVSTRRDEDRVSVAVQFSDPRLRTLAAEHVDRLQGALESRYDADVDLSFAQDEGRPSQEGTPEPAPALHSPASPTATEAAESARTDRPARPLGRNEWVG